MKKVLATDLDGTLFYPKHKFRMINPQSLAFLRKFIDDGNRLVLVSGRNRRYCNRVVKKIKRDVDIIGCNSSYIVSNNELIKSTCFEPGILTEIIEQLRKEFAIRGFLVMADDDNYICTKSFDSLFYTIGYQFWYLSQGAYRERFHLKNKKFYNALNNGHVYKAMLMFGIGEDGCNKASEANKVIREKYSDKVEASWSKEMIELSPVGCSKAEGLKYYLNYHKINPEDIIVVGDSGNDISMFNEFYENSFCMAQAPLSVSKYAKNIIENFWDLEKFIERK